MSLRELQEAAAEALLGEGAPSPARAIVRSKRRRLLAEACPTTFDRVPAELVDAFLAVYRAEGTDLESEVRAFLSFASDRVDAVTRDLLRYDLARRSLGRTASVETFSVDLRYLARGRVVLGAPRQWLLLRGLRPIPLGRARPPLEGGG